MAMQLISHVGHACFAYRHGDRMRILVPIDNSEHSKVPIDALLMREWPAHTEIKILSVVDLIIHVGEAEEFMAPIVERVKFRFSDATVCSEAIVGESKDVILEQSANWPADLVIMGARGRRGLARILLGSVSQTVLLYGSCSTLIARRPGGGADSNLQRVLVALDNSDHSRKALEWVAKLPWADSVEIKLVGVLNPLASGHADGFSALYKSDSAQKKLKAVEHTQQFLMDSAKTLSAAIANKTTTLVLEGAPGEQILKEASEWDAQLIVMGSRGHGGLTKLWLGSVSQEVVLQAPCPVEVIRNT
jgi:nucleotide-binding universal stress UspA family protein